MNKDSDITRNILLSLLFDPVSDDSSPSGEISHPQPSEHDGDRYHEMADRSHTAPDCSGPKSSTVADPEHLTPFEFIDPVFDSGDVTTVQTHFEALLKRRLRQEIEPRPPLFPWEKARQEYPDAVSQDLQTATVWLDNLQNLDIPSSVPEDILTELFWRCQQVAQQTHQSGRRLIAAVQALFPEQPQTLEYVAGLVSRPAYRSGQAQTLDAIDYDTASPQQQIALSMVAAQNIFEALSLKVSASDPTTEKHWLTADGTLVVKATYLTGDVPQLRVEAQVPQSGTLQLTTHDETVDSRRTGPGELVVYLNHPQIERLYSVDVTLGTEGSCPLQFQVMIEQA
jgi:hypothetical protein